MDEQNEEKTEETAQVKNMFKYYAVIRKNYVNVEIVSEAHKIDLIRAISKMSDVEILYVFKGRLLPYREKKVLSF